MMQTGNPDWRSVVSLGRPTVKRSHIFNVKLRVTKAGAVGDKTTIETSYLNSILIAAIEVEFVGH